jgi:hypothetical protein
MRVSMSSVAALDGAPLACTPDESFHLMMSLFSSRPGIATSMGEWRACQYKGSIGRDRGKRWRQDGKQGKSQQTPTTHTHTHIHTYLHLPRPARPQHIRRIRHHPQLAAHAAALLHLVRLAVLRVHAIVEDLELRAYEVGPQLAWAAAMEGVMAM